MRTPRAGGFAARSREVRRLWRRSRHAGSGPVHAEDAGRGDAQGTRVRGPFTRRTQAANPFQVKRPATTMRVGGRFVSRREAAASGRARAAGVAAPLPDRPRGGTTGLASGAGRSRDRQVLTQERCPAGAGAWRTKVGPDSRGASSGAAWKSTCQMTELSPMAAPYSFRGSMTTGLIRWRFQVYVMCTSPSAAWMTAG